MQTNPQFPYRSKTNKRIGSFPNIYYKFRMVIGCNGAYLTLNVFFVSNFNAVVSVCQPVIFKEKNTVLGTTERTQESCHLNTSACVTKINPPRPWSVSKILWKVKCFIQTRNIKYYIKMVWRMFSCRITSRTRSDSAEGRKTQAFPTFVMNYFLGRSCLFVALYLCFTCRRANIPHTRSSRDTANEICHSFS